jgi:bifunctional non-homologous end joining protein LigD
MAERWKPLPASAYKEDFRSRQPTLPATYETTPVRKPQPRKRTLPSSRASFTNVDKVLWPQEGYAKSDVIAYYDAVAEAILPHLRGRPLIMERYPNGIAEPYFLQKDALPQHTPDWMLPYVHKVYAPEVRRDVRYIVADHKDAVLYLANYAALTLHPWSSRLERLDFPDFVLFDLDPVDASFRTVQTVALALKSVFDELGLRAYPKTSGATGMHLYLPVVEASITYRDATVFASAIAKIVAQRIPDSGTTIRSVRQRETGKVYIDALQNGRGKTLAGVYSLRARPRAPVSTPLKWSDLKKPIDPSEFNMETVPKRIRSLGDLFEPVLTDRQDIRRLVRALRSA